MSGLFIGLMGALLATNQPQAVSNLIQQNTGMSVSVPNPNDPAEKELRQIMAEDDAAMAEVEKWIQENNAFAAKGAGESKQELNARILARLDVVRKHYEDFLRRYPDFVHGHMAFASFLNDIGDEEAAKAQMDKALQLDPKNPAIWNNLADYYAENGPITNVFIYLTKAIQLDPTEPVYYQNLANSVYLYRTDAKEFYHLDEQQVFDKSIALYHKAMQLDPDNFSLATDYAEGYYGIKPLRTDDALEAWTNALDIAHNDVEREGVYIHLARIKMLAGRFAEARSQLDAVTNAQYASLKHTVEDAINWWQNQATNRAAADKSTNALDSPTNILSAPTNAAIVVTNRTVISTNLPARLTNGPPALTNSQPFSDKVASVMTNVPPDPPKLAELKSPPAAKP
jgi:tetratricopeptide (TPR) repeat protein